MTSMIVRYYLVVDPVITWFYWGNRNDW